MLWVFLAHLGATWFMTGLIWFVQVVHYPLFSRVRGDYSGYQQSHMRRTTWVVAPMMLLEVSTAAALCVARPGWFEAWAAWANLGLLGLIWASTALLQVPAHQELLTGFAVSPHAALVRTNWLRTIAWSLRSAGLSAVLQRMVGRYLVEGI